MPRAPIFPETLVSTEEVETPGVKTCEALAEFLAIDVAATSKAMPVTTDDGTVVLALVRGDDRIEPAKLDAALGRPSRPATDEEIRAAFGASGGSLGPVGFKGEVIADETLRDGQFVAGANRDGWHLRGVEAGRDFQPRFADLRESAEGDTCPHAAGALRFEAAIEVGHIFKLDTRYSEPLGATFLDDDGQEKPLIMGSYGIGPARVMASLVEQRHDDNGIRWPASVAPYDVHIVQLLGAEEIAAQAAEALVGGGQGRAARRPRSASRREVRGRRPDRDPDSHHRRQEEPRGRGRRRPRPLHGRRAACEPGRPGQGGLGACRSAGATHRSRSAPRSSG